MGQPQAVKPRHVVYLAAAVVQILFASNTWSVPLWVARYSSSTNSYDQAENILLGPGGSVYVSGSSSDQGREKVAIVKYSSAGLRLWVAENTNILNAYYYYGPQLLTALDQGGGVRIAGFSNPDRNELCWPATRRRERFGGSDVFGQARNFEPPPWRLTRRATWSWREYARALIASTTMYSSRSIRPRGCFCGTVATLWRLNTW